MTSEELMKPRYKVIADWPGMPYNVGDILMQDFEDSNIWVIPSLGMRSPHLFAHPENWPHLFRRLQWWEDMKPGDLPEYVKIVKKDPVIFPLKEVKIVQNENLVFIVDSDGDAIWMLDIGSDEPTIEPATEQQYNEYL